MALLAYALLTLNEAKTYLGIATTVTTHDTLLELLINAATDWIEKYCGRRFLSTSYSNEEYHGTGTGQLVLEQFPVSSFTSLQRRSGPTNTSDWDTVDTELYFVNTDAGIVYSLGSLFPNYYRYRASYIAGYAAADYPYDLRLAALQLVSMEFKRRNAQGIKSETLGEYSVTWDTDFDAMAKIRGTLDRYAKRNV